MLVIYIMLLSTKYQPFTGNIVDLIMLLYVMLLLLPFFFFSNLNSQY